MSRATTIDPDFSSWRARARELLAAEIPPTEVFWSEIGAGQGELFGDDDPGLPTSRVGEPNLADSNPSESAISFRVPKSFFGLAETVACHTHPERWAVLYRLLWRMTREGERHLLVVSTDEDVRRARAWAKEVGRDLHKMRAFVRFRKVGETEEGREQFVAWFEPEHRIVRRNAPFFRKRFAGMDWSIFTPDECAHWDGRELTFSPGVSQSEAPDFDALEDLWRSYYKSIFNPARLKLRAMQSEMPMKYWKNLPEAELIGDLTRDASQRRDEMIDRPTREPRPAPKNLYLEKLEDQNSIALVREAEAVPEQETLSEMKTRAECCRACPLWERATRTVFGEGREDAEVMIIGEQPGDQEDLAGRPFVGPAGEFLHSVLRELGVSREDLYLTNAVKHFKWRPSPKGVNHRGPTRLHDKADRGEIAACRPWLWGEIAKVSPRVILTLGNTAGQGIVGPDFRVLRDRGEVMPSPDLDFSGKAFATVHPSYLLRLPRGERGIERAAFVEDLRAAFSHA